MTLIDGKAISEQVKQEIATEVAEIVERGGKRPHLAAILVGHDGGSETYVAAKVKACEACGFKSSLIRYETDVTEEELLAKVRELNEDADVDGFIVQLPLPKHISEQKVIETIDYRKDVDGFHISNVGLLGTGQKAMVPCTPLGCLMMLRDHHGSLAGMNAVVVGRSNIVGKPMAQLLLGDSCTVTIAHSRTRDLAAVCRGADILVAAVGRAEMITGDMVKQGATVIDVGINRVERDGKPRLVGDVHYASAAAVAGAITPVPGGVGPMTIACLLANTLTACCRRHGLPEPEGLTA